MAQLLVRKLDDSLVTLLRERAAKHGRSVEEEHRLILRESLAGIPSDKGVVSLEEYLIADADELLDIPMDTRDSPPAEQIIP